MQLQRPVVFTHQDNPVNITYRACDDTTVSVRRHFLSFSDILENGSSLAKINTGSVRAKQGHNI